MLSPNIDLTEYNDFSRGNSMVMDTPIDFEYYDEDSLMTSTEYECLVWWEGIFGKQRHPNARRILFPMFTWENPNFRIPWKEINNHSPFTYEEERIPWRCTKSSMYSDVKYNLFRLR